MFPSGPCGHNIEAPQKQWPTWKHTSSGSRAEILSHMGNNAGRVPSTTMNANRAKMLAIMAAGPATPMRYAVPNSTVTQNDERDHHNGHKHPNQKPLDSKSRPFIFHTKKCGDHLVTKPSQLGDTHSRAPTLESPCTRLRWSFDFQHFC